MRALLLYTLGFALPAFVMGMLLFIDHNSDSWSGNSPLNSLWAIPTLYLGYGFVALLAFVAARGRSVSLSPVFISGLISGLPLFIFPHQTAFLFSGWTAIALVVVGAGGCVATFAWRSTNLAG
jgi:hypothetical protein